MIERYGEYFSGSEGDLDKTLLEYTAQQPEASCQPTTRSRSRKSAGPAVLGTAREELQSSESAEEAQAALRRTALLRQRRRTLAPGQV